MLENFEYLVKAMDAFLQKSAQNGVYDLRISTDTWHSSRAIFSLRTSELKKVQGASYKGDFHFILF